MPTKTTWFYRCALCRYTAEHDTKTSRDESVAEHKRMYPSHNPALWDTISLVTDPGKNPA